MTLTELYELFRAHPIITTDTRQCPAGSLFFALKGERFDGNRFALQALDSGCAYAIVDGETGADDQRLIRVDDVLQTLQDLAHLHRTQFQGPVLQITGTNGKTTTKELVSAVLSQKYDTYYTQGNLNNHIGVPRTLLTLPFTPSEAERTPIAVIETGANHPGEIAFLTKIVDPDCGLITNVGRAHLEGFGSFEGVVRTKSELYAYLRHKPGSFIFLHGDSPYLPAQAQGLPALLYGSVGHGYEVEGELIECNPLVRFRWHVSGQEWHEVQTQLIGAYNVANLLSAVAVGLRYGVSPHLIDSALAAYTPHLGRSELRRTATNTLIVDAYNANATSMHAALDSFRQIPSPHKVAILGEMRELGAASSEAHREILQEALSLPLSDLWLVGREFQRVSTGTPARCFPDIEAVLEALAQTPITDALVLIKGSNGTQLYKLPQYL